MTSNILLLTLLGSLWGLSPSMGKLATTNGTHALALAFWSALISGLILLLFCKIRSIGIGLNRQHILYYIVLGFTTLSGAQVVLYMSAEFVPASILALIISTAPIIAYVITLSVGMQKFRWSNLGAVCLAVVAVLFLLLPKASLPSREAIPWTLFALLTPTMFALSHILGARLKPVSSQAISLASGTLLAAAIQVLPFLVFNVGFYVPEFPPALGDSAIYIQGLATSLAFFVWYTLLDRAGPSFTSNVGFIVTVFGVLYGVAIFGESLNYWMILSAILIFISISILGRHETN